MAKDVVKRGRSEVDVYDITSTSKRPVRSARSGGLPAELPALKPEHIVPGSAWDIDEDAFPSKANGHDQLMFCLRYAALAPSSHNTQPWKFGVGTSHVDVYADHTRGLPVADANGRELTISVGCAIQHLLAAMRRFGLAPRLALRPDKAQPDLLARVNIVGSHAVTPAERRVFEGIHLRRTTRTRYLKRAVPGECVEGLVAIAGEHGAALSVLENDLQRGKLSKLIAEADLLQFESPAFRRELAMWMHHNRSQSRDGIPGYAMGFSELESLVAPLVVRTFDVGRGKGAMDEGMVMHSPVLAVLGTASDAPAEWIKCGMALGEVLCRAAAWGIAASYLNQAVEVPPVRERLRKLVPQVAWPQIILRMGFSDVRPAHTPRRELKEMLVPMV